MGNVRIGIVGIGNMGSTHALHIFEGKVLGAELSALCDTNPVRLNWAKETFGEKVKLFNNSKDLLESGSIDAVIIATPHYDHPVIAMQALKKGINTLIEKPAGVYTKNVREMNKVAEASGVTFGIMLNQRTNPLYQKLRELVQSGEFGELKRVNWIITTWYRSQSYYNSGGWRASWAGEGGGVLTNQCPHQLDLLQWICGLPKKLRSFMSFGKYHNIEVEDEVTTYMEYANGATGVFITSTADSPGTNRFEILGDKGKAVIENGKLEFWKLRIPEREFNATYEGGFGEPESWKCEIPIKGLETAHIGILNDWVSAIKNGTKLLAPGEEGIKGLTLANAMYLSAWTNDWVELDKIDEDLFYDMLQEKIRESNYVKPEVTSKTYLQGRH